MKNIEKYKNITTLQSDPNDIPSYPPLHFMTQMFQNIELYIKFWPELIGREKIYKYHIYLDVETGF